MGRLLVWSGAVALVCLAAARADSGLRPGDMATVNKDGAEIKLGSTVLATLKKGQRVKVHFVHEKGGYVRVWFTMSGKGKPGYMSSKDLDPPERADKKVIENPFVVDDQVVVLAKEAKLKMGTEVLGLVPEGTRLTVTKVNGAWVGVFANIKGKSTFGWIHSREVDYPAVGDSGGSKDDAKK